MSTQTPPLAKGGLDPFEPLRKDHARIRQALSELEACGHWHPEEADPDRAQELYAFFTGPLLEHDQIEEKYVLDAAFALRPPPRIFKKIDACRKQHRRMERIIEWLLPHLAAVAANKDDFDPVLMHAAALSLKAVVDGHLRGEETYVFPLLQEALSPEDRLVLASQIRKAKGLEPLTD